MRKTVREMLKRKKATDKRRRQQRKNDCLVYRSGPKRRYPTRDDAKRDLALTRLHGKPGEARVFWCEACGDWHIGHAAAPSGIAPLQRVA